MSRAYLVAHFTTVDGKPTFTGTGVYSADASGLTCEKSTWYADVFSIGGKDFDEACGKLYELYEEGSEQLLAHVYAWANPGPRYGKTRYGKKNEA